MLGLAAALASAAAASPLPARIDMMALYDYDAALQSNWTTIGADRDLKKLIDGFKATGLPGLLRLDGDASGIFHRLESGDVALTTNWEDAWRTVFSATRPELLHGGALRGFFIGDELTAQGLPLADLERLTNAIHATLHADKSIEEKSRVIYENDSIFMATWDHIPHNLSHFSMDYYHGLDTGRIGRSVQDLYEDFVFPKLGPATKVLFVPQAYGSRCDARPGWTLDAFEGWGLGNLSLYEKWAVADERVVGFNPWHLLDRPVANATACASVGFGCCEAGVSSMPKLFAALRELGGRVRANARRR